MPFLVLLCEMKTVLCTYRNCLVVVVRNTDDPVVTCPYAGEYDCEQELLQHEIKEVFNCFPLSHLPLYLSVLL